MSAYCTNHFDFPIVSCKTMVDGEDIDFSCMFVVSSYVLEQGATVYVLRPYSPVKLSVLVVVKAPHSVVPREGFLALEVYS